MVEPDYAPYEKEINGLDEMQAAVGGYDGVFGPFFVCGLGEDSFCSLTPEQVERYKQKFHKAEILLAVKGNDCITMKVPPKQRGGPDAPAKAPKAPER